LSGQPFIIFYPAVVPITFIAGAPFALVGSILFVGIGVNQLKKGTTGSLIKQWAIKYILFGLLYGLMSSIILWLWFEDGNADNILVGIKYLTSNLIFTSVIISFVIARIWYRYNMKKYV
jgi:hypothetical protein